MKKYFAVLLYVTIISFVTVSNVSAQVFQSSLATSTELSATAKSEEKFFADISKATASKADLRAAKANLKARKANLKATTNFAKEFKNASNVSWFAEPKLIIANFEQEGVKTKVIYSKKGHWMRTMASYHESELSQSIGRQIKRTYPGYKITFVQDITEGTMNFQVIHLEDDVSYKQVCYYNGETGVISEFNK